MFYHCHCAEYVWCNVAIKYNSDNIKAYYRKAAALNAMSLCDRALQAAEQGRRQATSRRQEVSSCINSNMCCIASVTYWLKLQGTGIREEWKCKGSGTPFLVNPV